jgi:hypothetical protein
VARLLNMPIVRTIAAAGAFRQTEAGQVTGDRCGPLSVRRTVETVEERRGGDAGQNPQRSSFMLAELLRSAHRLSIMTELTALFNGKTLLTGA